MSVSLRQESTIDQALQQQPLQKMDTSFKDQISVDGGLSAISSKQNIQNHLRKQKKEINKLGEIVKQYEKIVSSKTIVIGELHKELKR